MVIYEMSPRRYYRTSDEGASASFVRMCRIRLLASKMVAWLFKNPTKSLGGSEQAI
jgi:hypothetical protein